MNQVAHKRMTKDQTKIFDYYMDQIEQVTGLAKAEILSKSRKTDLKTCRQILALCLRNCGFKLQTIASQLNCHHSTIIHSINEATFLVDSKHKQYRFYYKIKPWHLETYICPQCGHEHHSKNI